jgi:hypothetical protein
LRRSEPSRLSEAEQPSPDVVKESRFYLKYSWLGPVLGLPAAIVVILVMADVLPPIFATAALVISVGAWLGAKLRESLRD